MNTPIDEKLAYTFMVAGVVICRGTKYLLVQEKQPKAYGLWNLPAGKVDKGYSIEETAIKEAKEETGFDVELTEKLKIFQTSVDKPVKHSFRARIISGELKFPEDEIMDARWFNYEEIEAMKDKLREEWVLDSIRIVRKK